MSELDELESDALEAVLAAEASWSPGRPGPPGPPGPPLKALAKTCLSSSACELVSLPLVTSFEIRSLIFDCMSVRDGLPPLVASLLSDESMSVSAALSAFWSDELIVPDETSEFNSSCSRVSGEKDDEAILDEIVDMSGSPNKPAPQRVASRATLGGRPLTTC